MKYYKTPRYAKILTSSKFIGAMACFLIALGVIGWFGLSRSKKQIETPKNNSTPTPSYPNVDSSYNSVTITPEVSDNEITESVNDTVSEVPFVEETTPTESETEQETEKPIFVLPVVGNILKGYSDSALQYSATYNDMRLHTGVDISCAKNTNIKSACSGTVKSIVDDANLGKIITIEYNNILIKYCGMGNAIVSEGDKVTAGDFIGVSGEIPSECADKPHIHIEVLVDGKSVSPLSMLGLE